MVAWVWSLTLMGLIVSAARARATKRKAEDLERHAEETARPFE